MYVYQKESTKASTDSLIALVSPGIKASFRTRVPEGLIVFAASPGNQEEYFAIQLKNGRPYFLFDPQVNE